MHAMRCMCYLLVNAKHKKEIKMLTQQTTDYYKTGKLYPKLDAYMMDNGHYVSYLGSSCQFKNAKNYKYRGLK